MDRRQFLAGLTASTAALTSTPALARTSPKAFVDDLRAAWQGWRATPDSAGTRAVDELFQREGLATGTMQDLFACLAAAQHLKQDPEILESPEGEAFALEVGEVYAASYLPLSDWMKAMPRRRRRQLRKVLRDDRSLLRGFIENVAGHADKAGMPGNAERLRAALDEVEFRIENQDVDLLVDPLTERTDAVVARASGTSDATSSSANSDGLKQAGKNMGIVGLACLGVAVGAGVLAAISGGIFYADIAVLILATGAVVSLIVALGFFLAAGILYVVAAALGASWIGSIAGTDAELQLVFQDDGDVWGWDRSGAVAYPILGDLKDDRIELTLFRPSGRAWLQGHRGDEEMSGEANVAGDLSGAWSLQLA